MPSHEMINCPRCGAEFECKLGSILICHCSDVHLSKELQAHLAEHWQSCLCHRCLVEIKESFSEKEDYSS